jgi:hypothetical protein
MANAKHTVEPWQLHKLGLPFDDVTGGRFVVRSREHAPGGIAVIMGGLGEVEEAANASLFFAAPSLLSALKAIRAEAASWHEVHHNNPTVQCDSICALIPKMDAAIAKAEPWG